MLFNMQIVCGRITKDPEITTNQEGKFMARFGIATEVYKKGAGDYDRQTIFENIVVFGPQAEYISKSKVAKGHAFVAVCKVDEYQKDGDAKKYRTLIPLEFQTFEIVPRQANGNNQAAAKPAQQGAGPSLQPNDVDDIDDDLPF